MAFIYDRSVRFGDTDGAGVVYFANLLSMCHEAYEASLARAGIDVRSFFGRTDIVVPIIQAEIRFYAPVHCGDHLRIHVQPTLLTTDKFTCQYAIFRGGGQQVAEAQTIHVCIYKDSRQRCPLSAELQAWLAYTHHPEN